MNPPIMSDDAVMDLCDDLLAVKPLRVDLPEGGGAIIAFCLCDGGAESSWCPWSPMGCVRALLTASGIREQQWKHLLVSYRREYLLCELDADGLRRCRAFHVLPTQSKNAVFSLMRLRDVKSLLADMEVRMNGHGAP